MLRTFSKYIEHGAFKPCPGSLKVIYLGVSAEQEHDYILLCADWNEQKIILTQAWDAMQPCKSLVQEKAENWTLRLGKLGMTVKEVTGDTDHAPSADLDNADVICTTPEKLGEQAFVGSNICCPSQYGPKELLCRCHHKKTARSGWHALFCRGSSVCWSDDGRLLSCCMEGWIIPSKQTKNALQMW